jgi:hypothetical protein
MRHDEVSSSPDSSQRCSAYLVRLVEEAQGYFKSHPLPEALTLCDADFAARLKGEGGCRDSPQQLEHDLVQRPKFQELLALAVDYAPTKWLLEQEQPYLKHRRELCGLPADQTYGSDHGEEGVDPYTWAAHNRVRGVCLSGGGIRSATFNLGVLQGLARLDLLHRFDYLSSVSGGGYIHEFLAAWITREEQRMRREAGRQSQCHAHVDYAPGDGLREVARQLDPLPNKHGAPFHPEPIKWLRRYSNYLTPAKGLGSADMWVAVAIWLRNAFLNQIVLLSGLFALVLLLRGFAFPLWLDFPPALLTGIVGTLVLVVSWYLGVALYREYTRVREQDLAEACARRGIAYTRPSVLNRTWIGTNAAAKCLGVAPCLLASYFSAASLKAWDPATHGTAVCLVLLGFLILMGLVTTFAGGAWREYSTLEDGSPTQLTVGGVWLCVYSAVLAASLGTLTFLGFWWLVQGLSQDENAVLGPPLFLSVPFLTLVFGAGLVGGEFPDWIREWLARLRAWSLMVGTLWAVSFGIVLLGPTLIATLSTHPVSWSSIPAWVFTTIASLLAATSAKTRGRNDEVPRSLGLELLALIGPYVYILGLLLLLSWAAAKVEGLQLSAFWGRVPPLFLAIGTSIAVFLLFGSRVDINAFSLNSFYRNRLTRCYLGASNTGREPSPLTGFDDRDTRGLQISRLLPRKPTAMFRHPYPGEEDFVPYTGPFPIICTTLNLTFGEDLAWQERKAASFAFTPLYSGYTVGWTGGRKGDALSFNGFVPTYNYAFPNGGINIATAVAISGAAASPNWGYHTNPGTAFLMTMFDVRLGWWIRNPRRLVGLAGAAPIVKGHHPTDRATPRFAPLQLAKELLGMTGDASQYVYLSDGGHFDNMGLYELVRRRCHRILICDAEEDASYVFEGLGMAIRRCRIDFGVEITLSDLKEVRLDGDTKNSHAHFAYGSIRYPETVGSNSAETEGVILYLKSSLTGSPKPEWSSEGLITLPAEPADILNYKLGHGSFPHDSTVNQWFTESQFESYRRLGFHVVEEMEARGLWDCFLKGVTERGSKAEPHESALSMVAS